MFKILYHPKVVSHDIPKLSGGWKEKIRRAIKQRLTIYPDFYGKPLRRSLKNYRKLRVGDYRVIFKIQSYEVIILIIQHRLVVYNEVNKRI